MVFEKYLTKTGRLSINQPQEVKDQWYIQKFTEIHGKTYDYSKVQYRNTQTKVEIICKKHGCFLQSPNHHLSGKGCPMCGDNRKTKSTKQCIEDFVQAQGGAYDYSKVQYTNQHTKVEIICKEHGSFFQSPNEHLSGKGCPKCQVSNQNILYVLKCLDTGLVKIGITNNLNKRISTIGGNLEHVHHVTLESPRQLERGLHEKYKKYRIFNHNVRSGGTEFFKLSEQQIKELIEGLVNDTNKA